MDKRRCPKCHLWKYQKRFEKERRSCRKCHQHSRPKQSSYDRSIRGKARWLRKDHGYSIEDSRHLATLLLDPYCRCVICGVPRRWLIAQDMRGLHWKGLSVDHIEPGGPSTLGNTRILCRLCNGARGAKRLTDVQVLHRVRGWYEWRGYAFKDLWWMCSSPGHGGLGQLGTERIHPL